jgi:hypothetical protein
MQTLDYFIQKYQIDLNLPSPIRLKISREWSLPRIIRNLGFKVGAEIGVCEGLYSEILIRSNPDLKLYAIDPWTEYEGYKDYHLADLQQKYEEARIRLKPYNVEFIRDFSMNAVKRFADESLDFVYIDAAHDYNHVLEDIREWEKKVKKGGIIAGHDYGNRRNYGVVKAVTDWVTEKNIHPLLILNRRAVKSWLYIK